MRLYRATPARARGGGRRARGRSGHGVGMVGRAVRATSTIQAVHRPGGLGHRASHRAPGRAGSRSPGTGWILSGDISGTGPGHRPGGVGWQAAPRSDTFGRHSGRRAGPGILLPPICPGRAWATAFIGLTIGLGPGIVPGPGITWIWLLAPGGDRAGLRDSGSGHRRAPGRARHPGTGFTITGHHRHLDSGRAPGHQHTGSGLGLASGRRAALHFRGSCSIAAIYIIRCIIGSFG